MRKVYKKIWIIVISAILILMFSESIVAKEILSAKIELKDGSVIIGKIEEPLIISVKTEDGIKESLFSSVSTSLDSIKACVDCYVEFLGDAYTLASYEVNPWNYFSYGTIAR